MPIAVTTAASASGYATHVNNHPYVLQALKHEMDLSGPAMLQSHVPELAGELARRLCALAGGELRKVFFGSSRSEGLAKRAVNT